MIEKLTDAPRWTIAAIAALGLLILGYFGWQSISGQAGEPGPSKKVAPGTYDLRAEALKTRDAKETGAGRNDSGR